MNTTSRIFLIGLTIATLQLSPIVPVSAADEDMISQVYLEFDPETGEFKTALDPSAQTKNEHMQAQQLQEIQAAQDQLAAQKASQSSGQASASSSSGSDATTAAAAPASQSGGTMSAAEGADAGGNSGMLIAIVIAAVVILGAVTMMKRKGQDKLS